MELTSTQKWVTGYTLHKTDGMWDPFKLRNKYRLVDVTFERLLWVSHFEYLPFVSHSLRLSVPSINMLNESDSKCWISVLKLFSDFKYEAQWNVNASKKKHHHFALCWKKKITRPDENKMNLYGYGGKRKMWRRRERAHDPEHATLFIRSLCAKATKTFSRWRN